MCRGLGFGQAQLGCEPDGAADGDVTDHDRIGVRLAVADPLCGSSCCSMPCIAYRSFCFWWWAGGV